MGQQSSFPGYVRFGAFEGEVWRVAPRWGRVGCFPQGVGVGWSFPHCGGGFLSCPWL